MRTVFFGVPSFAVPTLEALAGSEHRPLAAVTQPDRPAGRGRSVSPPPVKVSALENNVAVLQPENPHDEESVRQLAELKPELFVVVAYSHIFRPKLLGLPSMGCINAHASLLPRYRGPAPIPWAILNGDKETGISVIRMARPVDVGPILGQRATSIAPDETAGELAERLARVAAEVVLEVVERIEKGVASEKPQDDSRSSYAPALTKEDGEIEWTHAAWNICNHIRAMTPWPSAYTFLRREGKEPLRVTMLEVQVAEPARGGVGGPGEVIMADKKRILVAAGEEAVSINRLKPAGGRAMTASEFVRGHRVAEGDRFGPLQQSFRFSE